MPEKQKFREASSSRNVEEAFQERHIAYVWLELKERFGFDLKVWQQRFNTYFSKQPRAVSKTEAFFYFGSIQINPLLNNLLSC